MPYSIGQYNAKEAFEQFKLQLTTSPVLCYPTVGEAFTLETNVSKAGLGAVLSQIQADNNKHLVVCASQALSPQKSCYAITELQTLTVVWAISHFHAYLYGHDVLVYTDHSLSDQCYKHPVSVNALGCYKMPQVFYLLCHKVAFSLRPTSDNLLSTWPRWLRWSSRDGETTRVSSKQNQVHLVVQSSQYSLHEALKGSWCILQLKGHYIEFKQTIIRCEHSLLL